MRGPQEGRSKTFTTSSPNVAARIPVPASLKLLSLDRTTSPRLRDGIVLDENSIEEHIPDELYVKAGMKKADVLSRISELKVVLKNSKRGGTLKELGDLKKLVSNSIASCLVREDLKLLSTIAGAIHLAQEKAMM